MSNLQPVENKALLKSSTFIFLIRFFPTLATLLVMILFSRVLPEGTYGTYQSFWVYSYLFTALATVGIPVASLSYNAGQLMSIYHQLKRQLWKVGIGLVSFITLSFTFFQYSQTKIHFAVAFAFFLSYVLAVLLESILLVFKTFKLLLIVNIIYSSLFVGVHVVAWKQQYSLSHLFACLSIFVIAKVLILGFALVKQKQTTNLNPIETFQTVKQHWANMYIYDITQIVFKYIDKFILSLFLSSSLFAIYFNGSIDIPFLPILLGAATSAALLHITSPSQEGCETKEIATVVYTSKVLSCIVFPLFFFLLFFRYELFEIVFTQRYIAAVPIFAWSICVLPLRCYGFTTLLQKRQQGGIINKGAILDLGIALALMYPLYLWIGLPGVALSFVMSTYLQAIYYLYHTARILKLPIVTLIPLAFWLKQLLVAALPLGLWYVLMGAIGIDSWMVLLTGFIITFIIGVLQLLQTIKKG